MAVRRGFSTPNQFSPMDEGDGGDGMGDAPPEGDGTGDSSGDGSGDGTDTTSPMPGDPNFVGPIGPGYGYEQGNDFPGGGVPDWLKNAVNGSGGSNDGGGHSGGNGGGMSGGGGSGSQSTNSSSKGILDQLGKIFGSGAGQMGLGGGLLALLSGLLAQKRQPYTGDVAPQKLLEGAVGKMNKNFDYLNNERNQGIQLPDATVKAPTSLSGGVLPFTVGGYGQDMAPVSIPGIGQAGGPVNPLQLAASLASLTGSPSQPPGAPTIGTAVPRRRPLPGGGGTHGGNTNEAP